jgi:hypothetical protein
VTETDKRHNLTGISMRFVASRDVVIVVESTEKAHKFDERANGYLVPNFNGRGEELRQ